MINLFLVGGGGFCGAVCRFLLGGFIHRITQVSSFPIGTFVVNIFGCLLIGVGGGLLELRQILSPELRLFLLIGFLGGFTTFSTFGFESWALLRDGEFLFASLNVVGQVMAGLTAVWVGYGLTRYL
ncbi:MAG: fluoride efflux transporter CrcB [Deltaproteobacteria bacterium]|nr:fluoride efflux transporter CrcB [Deltaproteobacteria bacterium]